MPRVPCGRMTPRHAPSLTSRSTVTDDQSVHGRRIMQHRGHPDPPRLRRRDPLGHVPREGARVDRQPFMPLPEPRADRPDRLSRRAGPPLGDRALPRHARRHEPFVRGIPTPVPHVGHGGERGCPAEAIDLLRHGGLAAAGLELGEHDVVLACAPERHAAGVVEPHGAQVRAGHERAHLIGDVDRMRRNAHRPASSFSYAATSASSRSLRGRKIATTTAPSAIAIAPTAYAAIAPSTRLCCAAWTI